MDAPSLLKLSWLRRIWAVGIVDHGQIRLSTNARLPEKAKVYVIVPNTEIEQVAHLYSPHLMHPEQASDFIMEVTEGPRDADL